MRNIEISVIFRNIGNLMKIRGDSHFRTRSYDKAADIIEDLSVDVSELIKEGKFQDLEGIGKTIEEKTREILDTGTCQAYEKLLAEIGIEALDLLKISGIGEKTASRLYNDHNIKNLTHLSDALEDGSLEGIKGFGKKTLSSITKSLEFLMTYRGARILARSLDLSNHLSNIISNCSAVTRHEFTGDIRRREEICRSIEIIVECADGTKTAHDNLIETITTHNEPLTTQIIDSQDTSTMPLLQPLTKIHLSIDNGFAVSIYLCSPAEFKAVLFLTTPTKDHLSAFPTNTHISLEMQDDKTEYWEETQNKSERDIYEMFGMSYIEPELRQYPDTVALSLDDKLPKLIEYSDMRGDLHTHTDWSDGTHTLSEMVEAAKKRELEYYAITDHSVSSAVANGLDQKRLLAQIKQVREVDAATEGITILAGSEVDIRRDGKLDFPDEILAQLDIVVASVHSQFTLSEADMTKRVLRAIENPYVMIIGHPTGRLLGRRPMYPINIEEIIAAAAENGTILEINGSPSRLDLGPEYIRMAKAAGVLISVNTDAHSIPDTERFKYGVNVARRSGLTKEDVINTYPLEKLRKTLKKEI